MEEVLYRSGHFSNCARPCQPQHFDRLRCKLPVNHPNIRDSTVVIFLELRTPRDMLMKAKREHSPLTTSFDIDNVFNFFVTRLH